MQSIQWSSQEFLHADQQKKCGTIEVKETKANLLITEYEMFKMKTDESISDMFTRLMQLINHLKALGKIYIDIELVRKVL